MQALTRACLAHPRTTLALLGAITAVLFAFVPRVAPEFGYRVLIGDAHPAIVDLDGFIERFGRGLPVSIVWECAGDAPCRSVFERESLEMAAALEAELAAEPSVQRVVGIASAPLLVPGDAGFAVRRLVEHGEIAHEVERLAARALRDQLWVGQLVSSDGRVGAIVVQSIDTRAETDTALVDAIRRATRHFEARGFHFHLTGDPVNTVVSGRALSESTNALIPYTVAVVALVLLLLSRSLAGSLAAIATMGVAVGWTIGLLGLLDWPHDNIHELLAPLVLIVGVCDAIHFLSRHAAELDRHARDRAARSAAALAAARDVGPACVVTTLTTGGAFLSFTASQLDCFVRLGVIATFGVASCLILTFTLLPLLLVFAPAPARRADGFGARWRRGLDRCSAFASRKRGAVIAVAILLAVVCATGWARHLTVDTNWRDALGRDFPTIRALDFVEARLAPARRLEVELELPPQRGVEDPEVLGTIAELSRALEGVPGHGNATSVVAWVSRLNRIVHDDDPHFERVGASPGANAELIELLQFSDARLLSTWMTNDRRRARISVEAFETTRRETKATLDETRQAIARVVPSDWGVVLTGYTPIQEAWTDAILSTQRRSFPIALAIVFAIVAVVLRSLRLAAVALLPTLLPVVMILGAMGWGGVPLDVGRSMLAVVLLGIGVDDAIHLLIDYRRRRDAGVPSEAAIRAAVAHTGPAIVTTSVALCAGFLTLVASAWASIASFGFLISIGITGALLASLVLLPALIVAAVPLKARSPCRPVALGEKAVARPPPGPK